MKRDNRCVREQITTRLIYNFLDDGTLDSYLDNDFYRCKTLAETKRNKKLTREYKKERKDLYKKASMSRSKRKSSIKRYKNDK